MTPKYWLILKMEYTNEVFEFETKEALNDYLTGMDHPESVKELEVISGFSITKRTRDGV